jgi:hypothetical protein
MGWIPGYDNL